MASRRRIEQAQERTHTLREILHEYSSLSKAEPPPKAASGPAIWSLVVKDMLDRDLAGAAKYGTRLQAGNGRDALVDAYQEALDLCVYLRQAIEERNHG